jgi:RND family efflux transporter MFP subunit
MSRLLGLALLLSLATTLGCDHAQTQAPAGPPPPPEVYVTQAVSGSVTDYEEFSGRLEAVYTVDLRARVTGYLEKVNFKDGDLVKKGDVLCEVDPRPYKAQLDQDQATLVNSKALVTKTEALYKRSLSLSRTGASAQEDIDNQRGDFEVAKAGVGQAEAKVRMSQLNLDFCKVLAPITGRVSRRNVDPGNLVVADNTVLTTIVSLDPMYAYFDVDERTLLRLRRLQEAKQIESGAEGATPVEMGLADEKGFPRQGTINFVDNRVDRTTGSLWLRGEFPNADQFLSPGLFVRVRIPIGKPHQAVLMTERALGTDQGQKYLFVLPTTGEAVAERRRVRVGATHEGGRAEILEGLREGELVVVGGLQRVRAGSTVLSKPIDMPAPTGAIQPPADAGKETVGQEDKKTRGQEDKTTKK